MFHHLSFLTTRHHDRDALVERAAAVTALRALLPRPWRPTPRHDTRPAARRPLN